MNKEETKEAIKVMQAFVDGKAIEYKWLGEDEWHATTSPNWDFNECQYRVKPESKYRPYADVEECFADVKKHGGWVRNKNTKEPLAIVEMHFGSVYLGLGLRVPYENLWNAYVWADDGSVCGVKEE